MKEETKLYIGLAIITTLILGVILMFTLSEKVQYHDNELSCDALRECLIIGVSCQKTITEYELWGFEWAVEQFRTIQAQRNDYVNNCVVGK